MGRPVNQMTVADLFALADRHTYRNPKLLRAVAGMPCMACGIEGRTQAAPRNQGKGMGIKGSDAWIMALCVECHREVDQGGSMTKAERREWEVKMVAATLARLIERGGLVVR